MAKKKLAEHLTKGGKIPFAIAPMYCFNKTTRIFHPFHTLKKQPRTMNFSLNGFDPKKELQTQFDCLQSIAAVMDYSYSYSQSTPGHCKQNNAQQIRETQFPHNCDSNSSSNASGFDLSHILNGWTMLETLKSFGNPAVCDLWHFGGFAATVNDIPSATDLLLSPDFSEVCFVGHSNVGKSSLVNRSMNNARDSDFHAGYALVSKKPGRTRMLAFFSFDFHLSLVDCMGYGFALNVQREVRAYWLRFMKQYCIRRSANDGPLKHVFVLLDASIAEKGNIIKQSDHQMFDFLDSCFVPFSIVITKVDCIHNADGTDADTDDNNNGSHTAVTDVMRDSSNFDHVLQCVNAEVMSEYCMVQPFVNVTSARLGFGITELQCLMANITEIPNRQNISEIKTKQL